MPPTGKRPSPQRPSSSRPTSIPDGLTRPRSAPRGYDGDDEFGDRGNGELKLSKDNTQSLQLLGKYLANVDTAKLKRIADEELMEKKRQERIQKQTLQSLNELLSNIEKKTGVSKNDILTQIKNKKGIAYDQIKGIENVKGGAKMMNDLDAVMKNPQLQRTLVGMKTDNEQRLEEIKQITDKEREDLKEFWSNTLDKWKRTLDKHEDQLKNSLLGPLNLLVAPIEEFVGGGLFEGIAGFFKKRKDKKAKRNPREEDLVKNNDVAMLFLWHKIKGFFGGKDENGKKDKKKEFIDNLIDRLTGGKGVKGAIKSLGPALLKALPIMAIIGGLVWSVLDGIAGMKMSKQWGTTKVSAFIGGFFGGKDNGWKGAFKNAGKGALIGFGIGMLAFGPIGGLVGALVGGLIWGVLGYIGGEKIAKAADSIGAWIKKVVVDFINGGFAQNMVSMAIGIFTNVVDFFKEGFTNIKDLFNGKKTIGEFVIDFANSLFSVLSKVVMQFMDKTGIGQILQIYLLNPIFGFFNAIGDFFTYLSSMSFTDMIKTIASGDFGTGLEKHRKGKVEERQYAKEQELVMNYMASDKKWMTDYANQKTPEAQRKFVDSAFTTLVKKGQVDAKVVTSVNDAIIRPDGKIIRTDVDDTIVATKNVPQLNPSSSGNMEAKFDTMIALLREILKKDLRVVLPQTTSELDRLINGVL